MKKYSYDLEGRLVVREGQKDNVIYADAIECIKERDAELARLTTELADLRNKQALDQKQCDEMTAEAARMVGEIARIKEEHGREVEKLCDKLKKVASDNEGGD